MVTQRWGRACSAVSAVQNTQEAAGPAQPRQLLPPEPQRSNRAFLLLSPRSTTLPQREGSHGRGGRRNRAVRATGAAPHLSSQFVLLRQRRTEQSEHTELTGAAPAAKKGRENNKQKGWLHYLQKWSPIQSLGGAEEAAVSTARPQL